MRIYFVLATICHLFASTIAISKEDVSYDGIQGPLSVKPSNNDANSPQQTLTEELFNSFNTPEVQTAVHVQAAKFSFSEQWFEQPLDHFDTNTKDTFKQRFWVNTRHYRPRNGAPVIVIDGGEHNGEDNLALLDTGIGDILARATGGVGVLLEHRYYGQSFTVKDFSTDSLRFLKNKQAAADSARFMQHVKFSGINEDLTAPGTPWIYYGASYAGARAAHMKVLYPDIVWGAIASSAITHATVENWQYLDIIRKAADPKCAENLVKAIGQIDPILSSGNPVTKRLLKAAFGLGGLKHEQDIASLLKLPIDSWQRKHWDPVIGNTAFDDFCQYLDKPIHRKINIRIPLINSAINYALYIRENYVKECKTTLEDCYGTFDDRKYLGTSVTEDWRLWQFQVCTEWGSFITAPTDPNVPQIVSKLLDVEYVSRRCQQAFPPGKYFSVPPMPNITVVDALGGFEIEADRLAFIDGEVDPWRAITPHSDDAPKRKDTLLRPFKLIPNGVHFYDGHGLRNPENEPPEIREIHEEMVAFVNSWLKDWNVEHGIED